jgi:hydrogenase nickel incorporation protein HypB
MDIHLIDIKKAVLKDNQDLADQIRGELRLRDVFMLNLMSSPGAGKTSLVLETIRRMKYDTRIGVIEGDIESQVDSEKIAAEGIPAVQLRTGDSCHLDAPMIEAGLKALALDSLDLIIIENVGNLVCPAEFDTGANRRAMILSVPEGDDKVLKYPLMFSVCDALVINKIDYLPLTDFNVSAVKDRTWKLNPEIAIFETSCRTGEGLDDWCRWLKKEMAANTAGAVDRDAP